MEVKGLLSEIKSCMEVFCKSEGDCRLASKLDSPERKLLLKSTYEIRMLENEERKEELLRRKAAKQRMNYGIGMVDTTTADDISEQTFESRNLLEESNNQLM
jgi:hypothetical protein